MAARPTAAFRVGRIDDRGRGRGGQSEGLARCRDHQALELGCAVRDLLTLDPEAHACGAYRVLGSEGLQDLLTARRALRSDDSQRPQLLFAALAILLRLVDERLHDLRGFLRV